MFKVGDVVTIAKGSRYYTRYSGDFTGVIFHVSLPLVSDHAVGVKWVNETEAYYRPEDLEHHRKEEVVWEI